MECATIIQNGFTLHLVLTGYWFNEMLEGRKDIEYRNTSQYWTKRIWVRRDKIAYAKFSCGYTKNTITRPVLKIDIGSCEYKEWQGIYYRLHLGPIIETTNRKN